jgi:hypothetical protein
MQVGDVLLLGNLVPHCKRAFVIRIGADWPLTIPLCLTFCVIEGTTENLSKDVRWSLDLRWQNPSLPCGFEWEEGPTGTVIANQCVQMHSASKPTLLSAASSVVYGV